VSRPEVSFFDSIPSSTAACYGRKGDLVIRRWQRCSVRLRAHELRSRAGDAAGFPGALTPKSQAGDSVGASATLCGPARRSRYCASDVRQVSAASVAACGRHRSPASVLRFSEIRLFVEYPADQPSRPVPNVGGAPAVLGVDCESAMSLFATSCSGAIVLRKRWVR